MPINALPTVISLDSTGGITAISNSQSKMQQQPVVEIIMPQQPSGNVPAFLAKLWKMVDNPETDLLISWTDSGNSFIIKNQAGFSRDLLPYYYKHSNMASFIRQLNMYGFHKVVSVESGGLKGERDEIEFAHAYFLRGQEHLLPEIKRKVPASMPGRATTTFNLPNIKSDKVNEVLTEVNMLKDKQEDTDIKLDNMRSENEALWQEVLNLRQKHSQQQKIVNKLIHFLMAVVQPRMASGIKRRYVPGTQLAIDSPSFKPKEAKLEAKASDGPTIQDITHAMGEKNDELMTLLETTQGNMSQQLAPSPRVELPATPRSVDITDNEVEPEVQDNFTRTDKYRLVDPTEVNSAIVQGPARTAMLAKSQKSTEKSPVRPQLQREISKEDFDLDITNMQAELDNLKDYLSGSITLDTSLVSSLFNPEENQGSIPNYNYTNLPNNITINAEGLYDLHAEDTKSLSYNPSLFELTAEDEDPESLMLSGSTIMPPPSLSTATPVSATSTPQSMDLNTPLIQEDNINPLSRI
jgi:hypothetical protein